MQTNRISFDYNFTMMINAYEQNKLLLHTYLNQSTDISSETKSVINEWLQTYRKGCEDIKIMTDEGYKMVEQSVSSAGQ